MVKYHSVEKIRVSALSVHIPRSARVGFVIVNLNDFAVWQIQSLHKIDKPVRFNERINFVKYFGIVYLDRLIFADAERNFHLLWLKVKKGEIVFERNVNRVSKKAFIYGLYEFFLTAKDVTVPGAIF